MRDRSLRLDADGRPHISYRGSFPAQELRYATKDSMGWQIDSVDGLGGVSSGIR